MRKPYCYVDETGIETQGRLFIVTAVILDVEAISASTLACEVAEQMSGKFKAKWKVSKRGSRLEYMRLICEVPELQGKLCHSVFSGIKDYETATQRGVAYMLARTMGDTPYSAHVLIDALNNSQKRGYSVRLRRLGVRTEKVRGIAKEENSPLMRLADALAGFVRDAIEGEKADVLKLYIQALADGTIIKCEHEEK